MKSTYGSARQSLKAPFTLKLTRQGFTLIELLVVIAIIALLAAILFPVFSRARENARKTTCLNNVKSLGVALVQYTQDFDEYFPVQIYYNETSPGSCSPNTSATSLGPAVGKVMETYVKSAQIWRCPSDTVSTLITTSGATAYMNVSYAYNSDFLNKRYCNSPLSLAEIKKPADVAAMWGAWGGGGWYADFMTMTPGGPSSRLEGNPITTNARIKEGHNGGGNLLFCDGHAKWLPTGKLGQELARPVPNMFKE